MGFFFLHAAVAPGLAQFPQPQQSSEAEQGKPVVPPHQKVLKFLEAASRPTKFFVAPTSRVLRSLEVSLAAGSAFGVGGEGGFLTRAGLGLGGVAEVEFSTTEVVNDLTGKTTRFPTRSFKVYLVPERLAKYWFLPSLAAQLRTSSWGSVVERGSALAKDMTARFEAANVNENLTDLSMESRFTTLYLVAGKDGELGGLHLGLSLTDVRTKSGWQWIFDNRLGYSELVEIPEMKKNILAPFGGLIINANPKTLLMAEVEAVPRFDYDVHSKQVRIRSAWMGIAGVRFFLGNWLSWDTGVRYRSDYAGIADAEINLGLNMVLPLKKAGHSER